METPLFRFIPPWSTADVDMEMIMFFPSLYHDDLFDDAFRQMAIPDHQMIRQGFSQQCMKTDIHEDEKGWQLDVDLPGLKKEEIRLSLKEGYLTILAQKDEETKENQKGTCVRRERWTGTMSRSFYVGDNMTENDIRAKFQNGVLTIVVPKKDVIENKEQKTIAIE